MLIIRTYKSYYFIYNYLNLLLTILIAIIRTLQQSAIFSATYARGRASEIDTHRRLAIRHRDT